MTMQPVKQGLKKCLLLVEDALRVWPSDTVPV